MDYTNYFVLLDGLERMISIFHMHVNVKGLFAVHMMHKFFDGSCCEVVDRDLIIKYLLPTDQITFDTSNSVATAYE